MIKVIYKYKLEPEDIQELELPAGSKFLSAGTQVEADTFNPSGVVSEDIYLWFLVPVDEKVKVKRKIFVFGTGTKFADSISNPLNFLQTVFFKTNRLVFHIFQSPLDNG